MAPFIPLAKRLKRMAPLLAAPAALLLSQGQAKAVLTYNIFESGTSVVVQASGSLDLTGAGTDGSSGCDEGGLINSAVAVICTGGTGKSERWFISGPLSFGAGGSAANSTSGIPTTLYGASFYLFSIEIIRPNLQLSALPRLTTKLLQG